MKIRVDEVPDDARARAKDLCVWHHSANLYMVAGGEEAHWVYVHFDERGAQCDCGDFIWRQRPCKHIAAVFMEEGEA